MDQEMDSGNDGDGAEYQEVVYASICSALAVAVTRKDYEVIVAQCESIAGYRDVDEMLGRARQSMEALKGKPDVDEERAKRKQRQGKKIKSTGVIAGLVIAVIVVGLVVTGARREAYRSRYVNVASANRMMLEKHGGAEYAKAQRAFMGRRYATAYEQLIPAVKKASERRRAAELAEQKRLAAEAEKKRLAEEAERKRKAYEEAERKRLAEEAERKRLAEEAERKRLAEEAERRRLEQEAERKRVADQAELKRLAEQAEQKRLAEQMTLIASNSVSSAERKRNLSEAVQRLVSTLSSSPTQLAAMRSDRLDGDAYWAWAIRRNTPQAFRCFLYHFPKDYRAKEARSRWESLDLDALRKDPSVFARRRYVGLHPQAELPADVEAIKDRPSGVPAARLTYFVPQSDVARRAADVLLAGLVVSGLDVRSVAVRGLGEIRDVRAVEPLVEMLKDRSWGVRSSAAEALADIGDSRAVEPLAAAVDDGDSRLMAALQGLDRERAFDVLMQSLDRTNRLGRTVTARALGKSGDPRVLPYLIRLMDDPEWITRSAAAEALGEFKESQASGRLVAALKDPNDNVKRSAANSLGKYRDEEGEAALIAAFENVRSDSFLRMSIARALLERGSRESVDFLLKALQFSRLSDDQSQVAYRLSEVDKSRTCAALAAAGRDTTKFWTIRNAAIQCLAAIDPLNAAEELIPLLQDSNAFVRKDVIRLLGDMGDPSAVPALTAASRKDSDSYARSQALEAIGRIGDPVAVGDLLGFMNGSDPYIIASAARGLGSIGDARAIEPLAAGCRDRSAKPWLRTQCAVELAKIDHEYALRLLVIALEDPDSTFRQAAIDALGDLGDPRVAPCLLALSRDEGYHVSSQAVRALGNLKGEVSGVEPALVAMLQESRYALDPVVAHAVLKRGNPAGLPVMSRAKNYSFRDNAVRNISDARCCNELLRMKAQSSGLDNEIEEAIKRIVARNGLKPLLQALDSDESVVRVEAAELLAKMALKEKSEADGQLRYVLDCLRDRGDGQPYSDIPTELEKALMDENAGVRVNAALTVVRMLGRAENTTPVVGDGSLRPEVEPVSAEKLTGARWFWSCPGGSPSSQYMKFMSDGTIVYGYTKENQQQYRNGRWSLSKDSLVLNFNNGYAIDTFPVTRIAKGVWNGTGTTRNSPLTLREVSE